MEIRPRFGWPCTILHNTTRWPSQLPSVFRSTILRIPELPSSKIDSIVYCFVFDDTLLAISCGRSLFVDVCPLLLHFYFDGLIRSITAAGDEPVNKVGRKVCADEPQPTQGSESEGDEEGGPEDDTGHADPEETKDKGGKQGERDGAQHEGREQEDGDKGEQKLGDDEGLWRVVGWSAECRTEARILGRGRSDAAYKQEGLVLGKAEDTVIGLLAVVRAHDAVGLAARQVNGAADVVVNSHVPLPPLDGNRVSSPK